MFVVLQSSTDIHTSFIILTFLLMHAHYLFSHLIATECWRDRREKVGLMFFLPSHFPCKQQQQPVIVELVDFKSKWDMTEVVSSHCGDCFIESVLWEPRRSFLHPFHNTLLFMIQLQCRLLLNVALWKLEAAKDPGNSITFPAWDKWDTSSKLSVATQPLLRRKGGSQAAGESTVQAHIYKAALSTEMEKSCLLPHSSIHPISNVTLELVVLRKVPFRQESTEMCTSRSDPRVFTALRGGSLSLQ